MTNASIATAALHLAGTLPASALAFTWWAWWIGDTLGVLIAAPATLALIGRPRSLGPPRDGGRAAGAGDRPAGGATLAVARWDEQRLRSAFERDAATAADGVSAWLNGPLQALQAMQGAFQVQPQLSREDMRRVADWWLRQPLHLQAIGFSERLARDDIAAFEAAVRAEGLAEFRVFDRDDRTDAGDEVVAIRYIEPQQPNATALGVNALSIDAAADAVRRTLRSGQPAPAPVSADAEPAEQIGIVIHQALPGATTGRDAWASWPCAWTRRWAGCCRPGRRAALVPGGPDAVRAAAGRTRGCENAQRLTHAYDRVLTVAGREWELRLTRCRNRSPSCSTPMPGCSRCWG